MATNLSIDPDLIKEALELTGERAKKAAVTETNDFRRIADRSSLRVWKHP